MHHKTLWGSLLVLCAHAFGPAHANAQVYVLRDTFCSNQLIIINNHLYGPDHPSGTETLPGAASNGMDSIIEVRLVFLQPSITYLTQTLCKGDTVWVNNVPYHAGFTKGEEVIEGGAANGCDSTIQVDLTFLDKAVIQITNTICEGDTVWVNGTAYDAFRPVGQETVPGGGPGICDSIYLVNLTVLPLPYSELSDTLCPDTFLMINGRRYDRDNRYGLEILPGASYFGCDSLVNIHLTFRDMWMSLGEDLDISMGDSVCLLPLWSSEPIALEWTPALPCSTLECLPYCQAYYSDQSYHLSVTDPSGCRLTDDLIINVARKPALYIPNAVMPDGAWPNNRFYMSSGAGIVKIRRIRIVDRWGEIVHEQKNIVPGDPHTGWDGTWNGKFCPSGVYFFSAETEWWDGTTEQITGSFTLIY